MTGIPEDILEKAIEAQHAYILHRHDEGTFAFRETLGIGYGEDDVDAIPEWAEDIPSLIEGAEQPVNILDIGAGHGTFLEKLMDSTTNIGRAIGFTAAIEPRGKGVEWVTGDFQRQNTWLPQTTLAPESIDIITSGRTFTFFVDPLRGLENAFKLLRPGGHAFIDGMLFLTENRKQLAAKTIAAKLDELSSRKAGVDIDIATMDAQTERLFPIKIHLQKGSKDPDFRNIVRTRIWNSTQNQVVYGVQKPKSLKIFTK